MRRDLPIAFFGFVVSALVCAGLSAYAALHGEVFWAVIAGASALGCAAIAALVSRPKFIHEFEVGEPDPFLASRARETMGGDTFIPPEPPPPGHGGERPKD